MEASLRLGLGFIAADHGGGAHCVAGEADLAHEQRGVIARLIGTNGVQVGDESLRCTSTMHLTPQQPTPRQAPTFTSDWPQIR